MPTIGKQMLNKLEGVLSHAELAQKLSDAYSTKCYRNGWINCVRMLRKRGYDDDQIEVIIRSKVTRWAGDNSTNRYGSCSANDLAKYMDKNPQIIKDLWDTL